MRTVERQFEAEPRAVERRGAFGILGRNHDVIEAQDRRRRICGRARAFVRQFQEEHPDAPRQIGRGAGTFPAQYGARAQIAALDFSDRVRLQRNTIEPAMRFRDVVDAETDAGEPFPRYFDDVANAVSRRRIASRSHQLERHVVEGE
jgi:hypothetical protein